MVDWDKLHEEWNNVPEEQKKRIAELFKSKSREKLAELFRKDAMAGYVYEEATGELVTEVNVKLRIDAGTEPGEYFGSLFYDSFEPAFFGTPSTEALKTTLESGEEVIDKSEELEMAGFEAEDLEAELKSYPWPFSTGMMIVCKWKYPEDVEFTEKAKEQWDIYHAVYKREDLEALSVDDLKRILAVKKLSTAGKKEDLVNRVLGVKPPEVPPAPPVPPVAAPPAAPPPAPPKAPPVKAPPLVPTRGLQKVDEKRLLVRFDALLLERTITPAKWRPMFEDRLYDWREAFKDLPREEAMEKAFGEVERLVGDVVGLAKPPIKRLPEVAPPGAPPAAPEVYVPPAEVLGPRIPRIRIRKCWVADCPETFEADEDLEQRARMIPVMKADTPHLGPRYEPLLRFPPLFYYLCPEHRMERFGYKDVFDALAYLYFETESSTAKRLTVTKETFRDVGLSIEDMTIIQARAARWRPE